MIMFNIERHTAIPCSHSVESIRERLHAALLPDDDTLPLSDPIEIHSYKTALSNATSVCLAVMLEHAEEIAAEYRTILGILGRIK
jgi:hypothetical protein